MELVIYTEEFNSIIELVGATGEYTIYEESGKTFVSGKLYLVTTIGKQKFKSDPSNIDKGILELFKNDSKYFIKAIKDLLLFNFSQIASVCKNDFSAILYFDQITLIKTKSLEVSFDRVALSIIGPIKNPNVSNYAFYFSSTYSALKLTKLDSPVTRRPGFYLYKSGSDIQILIGSPTTSITLDDFKSIGLGLSNETIIKYSVISLNVTFKSTNFGRHLIQIGDETDWELDNRIFVDPTPLPITYLEIDELVCVDGWITSTNISNLKKTNANTTISKINTVVGHNEARTKLFTDVTKLRIHYPLEISTNSGEGGSLKFDKKTFLDVPQFVYNSDLNENLTLENQHFGIRVRGLTNEKGASVKLDTDLAVIRLDENTGKLYLQAGDKVKVKGLYENSKLIPKINPFEAHKRLVKIPCLPASLIVQGNTKTSSFIIDTRTTEENNFIVLNPQLETSPFAPGTSQTTPSFNFQKLSWITPYNRVEFKLLDNAVKATSEKWLNGFKINPDTSKFRLLDRQNAEIEYDKQPQSKALGLEITTKIESTGNFGELKERLIYVAYAGAIGLGTAYLASGLICQTASPSEIFTCLEDKKKEILNITFDTSTEPPEEVKKWLINQGVNELLIAYYKNDAKIKEFIDRNIKLENPTKEQPTAIGFWPVFSFIGMPLIKKKFIRVDKIETEYCFKIIENNFPGEGIICGIGIDQNKSGSIDLSRNLGFSGDAFKQFATHQDYKNLFPYYNEVILKGNETTTNGKTDPTDPKFAGFIFRHMPLMVKVPSDKIPKKLETLIKKINENLFLEFGWRDDRGFTWISKIPEVITNKPGYDGVDIINNSIVKFNISKINCLGQESKLLKFSFNLFLGIIKVKEPNDFKISLDATASITFNDKGVDNFLITPNGNSKKAKAINDTIPGFNYIKFNQLETNFKQLFADVELFPDDKLVEALPIFGDYKRSADDPTDIGSHVLKTTAAFDMETGVAVISIILNAGVKLFGKWPLAIRAVNIFINSPNGNRVEFVGEFNLGIENFIKAGGRVVISHHPTDGWNYDIELDKIGGSLALSDEFKIEGEVAWGKMFPETATPPRVALERDKIVAEGKSRDFYGLLLLKSPGIFGEAEIYVKIASKDGIPYWLLGLRFDGKPINLGFAKLQNPELIFVKNSDLNNQINTIVTNIDAGIKSLRKDDNVPRAEWLQKWGYSDKTGFTIIASGYLVYDLMLGMTVKPKDYPKGQEKFTALLYSSSGIIRIEGWIKMFEGIDDIGIMFTIDLRKKRLLVAFQLPTFYYPTKEAPSKYTFQPGQIILGTSFGGPFYFLSSFGWPPQIGDSYNRDWSKSNQVVYEPPTWPLPNMFGGGFKFEFDVAGQFVLFAIAVKVGWKYEINFAIGKAGLEVGLGGVMAIKYVWGSSKFETFSLQAGKLAGHKLSYSDEFSNEINQYQFSQDAFNSILYAYQTIRNELELAAKSYIAIMGEIFADIKGYASVGIFGVTLAGVSLHAYARMRVCGRTDKGITHLGGSFGAEFCVTIACVTYCKTAEIAVTVISGPCDAAPFNYQYLPQNIN